MEKQVETLILKGKSPLIKGFVKKDGDKIEGYLFIKDGGIGFEEKQG